MITVIFFFFLGHIKALLQKEKHVTQLRPVSMFGQLGSRRWVQVHLCQPCEWGLWALVFSSVRGGNNSSLMGLPVRWMKRKWRWKGSFVNCRPWCKSRRLFWQQWRHCAKKRPDPGLLVGKGHSWAQEVVPLRHDECCKCLLGQETDVHSNQTVRATSTGCSKSHFRKVAYNHILTLSLWIQSLKSELYRHWCIFHQGSIFQSKFHSADLIARSMPRNTELHCFHLGETISTGINALVFKFYKDLILLISIWTITNFTDL